MTDLVANRARGAINNMATVLALELFAGREDTVGAAQAFTSALVDLIDSRIEAATGVAP